MLKIILLISVIIVGLFSVYVINNKTTKQETKTDTSLNIAITKTPMISQSNQNTDNTTNTNEINTVEKPVENASVSAIIKTDKGNIELTLYPKDAPNTVANFVQKAKSGFYKNLTFHRVEDWVIQGGDPLGNGTGGGKMPTELNNKPFIVGSLGVARGGDINVSNDAQFFVTKTDASWLNSQYTNFGIVTKGIDIVSNIEIGDKISNIELEP